MTTDSNGQLHAPAGTPDGGRFMRHFRRDSDIVLEEQAPSEQFHQVKFDTVQVGDEVVNGSTSSGFVVRTDVTDGVHRLILHNGSRVRFDVGAEDTPFEVRRRTEPLPYDLTSHDYWANVAAARDPRQSVEVLQEIVDAEAEDDFMLAIVEHPKATPEMLDKASRHNSLQVREAALNRDELWMETLWRMKRQAEEAATQERELLRAEGVSPNARYREQTIAAYEQHAAKVTQRLAGASWRD